MTRQLVKKSRTDKRKRKGYKGTKSKFKMWDLINPLKLASTPGYIGLDQLIASLTPYGGLFKHGGRVKGVGKATHGYGRAMRKRK
tara:strand:- start:209 stop:463 length:255 start_codon:yes stop_codon:yes gene_type:complete